jgi:hypothetical protein
MARALWAPMDRYPDFDRYRAFDPGQSPDPCADEIDP